MTTSVAVAFLFVCWLCLCWLVTGVVVVADAVRAPYEHRSLHVYWSWRGLWAGIWWDHTRRRLITQPIPCLGWVLDLKPSTKLP